MIVTCERCATQFQLDDAKVKGDGIRVRCSRCKHAFFVKSASNIADEAADEVDRLVRAAMEENEIATSIQTDLGADHARRPSNTVSTRSA